MSEIRVNKIVDENGTGPVELKEGATLPVGKTLIGGGTISLAAMEVSTMRANYILNEPGTDAVELKEGAIIPSGKKLKGSGHIDITGNANITGITTVAQFSTDTINANKIVNQLGTGSVELSEGAVIPSGKTLSGDGEIDITTTIKAGTVKTSSLVSENGSGPIELTQGATIPSGKTLSGAGDINVSGDVTIGGTLTYDDVTNVDSIGLITTQQGFAVIDGGVSPVGISTFKGAHFDGGNPIKENVNISTDSFLDEKNIDLQNGMIDYRSTPLTSSTDLNLIFTSSATSGVDANISVGEAITVNAITFTNNDAYFVNGFTIDSGNVDVTLHWVNEPPSNGGSSGVDIYTFTIMKTADADANTSTNAQFLVIGNQTKTS